MSVWNDSKYSVPEVEGQYLCCKMYSDKPYFCVLSWSNDLRSVDDYDFNEYRGVGGFYDYDSEWGYFLSGCNYWQEIEWSDENGKNK